MTKLNKLFETPVKVINIGLSSFARDLEKQGVENVHIDWRPPAGGNRQIQKLLEKIYRWQEKVTGEAKS
jgi:hypothetical protein